MAASTAAKEVLGIINIIKSFTVVEMPIIMHIDNVGATYLTENEIHNKRSKHIDIRFHHVRDLVAQKVLKVVYIKTKDVRNSRQVRYLGLEILSNLGFSDPDSD